MTTLFLIIGLLSYAPSIELPTIAAKPAVDLDRLSVAVARHETGNCTASVGSALRHNCHGFKVGGKFLSFDNTAESDEYFKALWQKSYQGYPDIRLATAYVCGWKHLKENGTVPCAGGNPASWLASVTRTYQSL